MVTVPSKTQSGTKLRLKGKGAPRLKEGGRGDLYVIVKIVLPEKIDKVIKGVFENLAKTSPYNPRADLERYIR